jgi:hypothetical protein
MLINAGEYAFRAADRRRSWHFFFAPLRGRVSLRSFDPRDGLPFDFAPFGCAQDKRQRGMPGYASFTAGLKRI